MNHTDFQLPFDFDAYRPAEIAARVETAGLAKIRQPLPAMLMLSALAGRYISFGAVFYTIAVTGSDLGWGPTRLVGDVAFSLGLIRGVGEQGEPPRFALQRLHLRAAQQVALADDPDQLFLIVHDGYGAD